MEIKDINNLDYGTIFKMKNSNNTFVVTRKYYRDYSRSYVELATGLMFDDVLSLVCFGYVLYYKENDRDFRGVEVLGHISQFCIYNMEFKNEIKETYMIK